MSGLLAWWDGVEEWLTNLAFVPQLLVVLAVVLPIAIGASILLNMLVNAVSAVIDRRSVGDEDGRGF